MVLTVDLSFRLPFTFLAMHQSTGTVSKKDIKCMELSEVI